MPNKLRLTYANVVSTLALFLVLSGGAAFAASKFQVHTRDIVKRAVTSGKLAVGAVRSNQIANGAVGAQQIGSGSVTPANLQFPVFYAASPTGGSAPVTSGMEPYSISDSTWAQKPGQINVVFGAATGTLAYDGSGEGACRVYFEINLNGQQVGGGELRTESTTPTKIEQSVGAQPSIDPVAPINNQLTARIGSNGDCAPGSTVDSTRFRVLDFG